MPEASPAVNFDLLITRAGRAIAPTSSAPAVATPRAALPCPSPRRRSGGWWAAMVSGPGRGAHPPSPNLRDLGGRLYNAIFQEAMHSVLVSSQAEAERAGHALRIRLRFSEDAVELATLPWEILFDPQQQHFLALSERRPILRYLSLPRARPSPRGEAAAFGADRAGQPP